MSSAKNSKDNSESANLEKARRQKTRILKAIKEAELAGKFTITFQEVMWDSNKTYLTDNGYTLTNHGGPQNTFFNVIDWKSAT